MKSVIETASEIPASGNTGLFAETFRPPLAWNVASYFCLKQKERERCFIDLLVWVRWDRDYLRDLRQARSAVRLRPGLG